MLMVNLQLYNHGKPEFEKKDSFGPVVSYLSNQRKVSDKCLEQEWNILRKQKNEGYNSNQHVFKNNLAD